MDRVNAMSSAAAASVHEPRMPSRGGPAFLDHSLTIGAIAGTNVRLHWTLVVYLAWIGIAGLFAGGSSAAISSIGLMTAVFLCVLAHEFGHILTARRFGIPTPDVTLLPIGGVARLQRIPERAGQELAVAIAGPLVNLAIAAMLMGAFGVAPQSDAKASLPTVHDILPTLVTINLFLAAFNLIPAFPMDGGRLLRAALAMFTDRLRATRIAAAIGQVLAIGFGLLGLVDGNVLLIFIAIFVYLAAGAEARDVRLRHLAHPLRVSDVTMSELHTLPETSTLRDAAHVLIRTGQNDIPVFDRQGRLVGILSREQIVQGLRAYPATRSVGAVMTSTWHIVPADGSLDDALTLAQDSAEPIVVIDRNGRFGGLLARSNLRDLLVASA